MTQIEMILPSSFRTTIFISLLGHITVFSIFSLSFGNIIPKASYISVSFWGQLLGNSQVSQPLTTGKAGLREGPPEGLKRIKEVFIRKTDATLLDKRLRESPLLASYYLKPTVPSLFHKEKEIFVEKSPPTVFISKRKEPVIIFHPLLPYSFMLYFKDRQIAHVELMFNIVSSGLKKSILVKRKISSGNLEVDLLSMRYIGRYLFIQQARFTPNNWQDVKIDLSAKND